MMSKFKLITAVTALLLAGNATQVVANDDRITGRVDCIAPAGPGGGWDFTCRSLGRLLHDVTNGKITVQTLNMPGAGGGVGFAHMITKRAKDPKVIAAASTATTARLAQNEFPGMNSGMVRWVGAIGTDPGVIVVNKNSKIKSLEMLVDMLKEDPKSVTFAGASAIGGWDHLKILMVAHAAGVKDLLKIKYLSYNNGGTAVTQVVGGHIDVLVGVASSAKGFLESGDLVPLVVLGPDSLSAPLDYIPTSKELGYDLDASNWRGFYMAKDVSEEDYQWWVSTLREASKTEAWATAMKQSGLEKFDLFGPEFEDFVNTQIETLSIISKEIGMLQ